MVLKNKRSQSEVVTSVLLVLVAIVAVTILSAFVVNMVRDKLKGTECFDSVGQLSINLDTGYSFFNTTSRNLYVNVERSTKNFNLSKLAVIFGTDSDQRSILISSGVNVGVYPADNIAGTGQLINLPGLGEVQTYVINISRISTFKGNVTIVAIAPVLLNDVQCDQADEKNIPSVT